MYHSCVIFQVVLQTMFMTLSVHTPGKKEWWHVWALRQFVVEGRGTPSPAAPPVRLVRGGPYRFLRHPQYAATTAVIAGQGLALGQSILLIAAAVYALTTAALARFVEEPALARRHG